MLHFVVPPMIFEASAICQSDHVGLWSQEPPLLLTGPAIPGDTGEHGISPGLRLDMDTNAGFMGKL
jgi:hypothetical protein